MDLHLDDGTLEDAIHIYRCRHASQYEGVAKIYFYIYEMIFIVELDIF